MGVVPRGAGGAMAPSDFGRSVNPISTRGNRLCPPNYYWQTRIFRPSDDSANQNVFDEKNKLKNTKQQDLLQDTSQRLHQHWSSLEFVLHSVVNKASHFATYTIVSFIPFFIFGFWSFLQIHKNTKILCNLCLYFARQDGQDEKKRKENHATKVTKIPKTKRQKYVMNQTYVY